MGDVDGDYLTTLTLSAIPGTDFVFDGPPAIYLYTVNLEIGVTDVPGNQAWNVDIVLFDITADVLLLGPLEIGGSGNPDSNLYFDLPQTYEISGTEYGHTLGLGCQRNTATGDVYVIQGSSHTITGPL